MQQDFAGTIAKVAAIGYEGVEFAGFFGNKNEDVKAALDNAGVTACSAHVSIYELENFFDGYIELCKLIGIKDLVVPWIDIKEYESSIKSLAALKEKLEKAGFNLHFHNHTDEFTSKHGDDMIMDYMFKTIDGLQMELDTAWSDKAGIDSPAYMKKYGSIMKLVHIKDYNNVDGNAELADLGEGQVDIPSIVKAAKEIGSEWLIVENDDPVPNGLSSLEKSFKYLKALV